VIQQLLATGWVTQPDLQVEITRIYELLRKDLICYIDDTFKASIQTRRDPQLDLSSSNSIGVQNPTFS
jgi:hypothetical protein